MTLVPYTKPHATAAQRVQHLRGGGLLECLDYLLTQRGAPVGIVAAASRIIGRFPEVHTAEVGY